MKIKGLNKFKEKLPILNGKKLILLPLSLIIINIFSLLILLLFNILPTYFPNSIGFQILSLTFPIIGVILIEFIALFLVYNMWHRRDRLKQKYKQLSYQKIFFFGFIGVIMMFGLIIYNFISGFISYLSFWSEFPYIILTTPLTTYFLDIEIYFFIIRLLLGLILVLLGILLIKRAIEVFGIDYMAVVYLYFPEESEIQNHEIYSILRHPTYTGLILINLGVTILNFNLYSIIYLLLYYFGFLIHIHYVEEKELIQRFGDSYNEYKRNVPAFLVKPKNLKRFFKFILYKIKD